MCPYCSVCACRQEGSSAGPGLVLIRLVVLIHLQRTECVCDSDGGFRQKGKPVLNALRLRHTLFLYSFLVFLHSVLICSQTDNLVSSQTLAAN